MVLEETQIKSIRNQFQSIENKNDLLKLINYVSKIYYRNDTSKMKLSQLTYYADPYKSKNRYRTFQIKKKSGENRTINAPNRGLNKILKILNLIFQCVSEPHRLAFGFVPEKSIVDNAKIHINQNYVYNIDLKDFFHSFDRNRVKMTFILKPFNLNGHKEPIAFMLASLCTHPLLLNEEEKVVLPQGSPTSPTLTNAICVKLDRRLNGLAKKMGVKYSRYADDITFSSTRNIFKNPAFTDELNRIIEDQKLKINPKKTRLQSKDYRQEVTGLKVNDKINVQTRYIKQLRMWLYYWEKYGLYRAQQLFINDYKKDKGHLIKNPAHLSNVVEGKLLYLKMVKGENDSTYLKLKERYDLLINKNSQINSILDIWEKEGIDKAIEIYYQKKVD